MTGKGERTIQRYARIGKKLGRFKAFASAP